MVEILRVCNSMASAVGVDAQQRRSIWPQPVRPGSNANNGGNGSIVLTEAKGSATAPLTKNQKLAHPSIELSGGVVVGQGKPGFPGGTTIPPTKVDVVRPSNFWDYKF